MNENIKKWLLDIKISIDSISEFVGEKKDFFEYEKEKKLRRAVEREIEIIGEAVKRINQENTEIKITNARQIIATRNQITHAYDAVNNAIIWGIVVNHLPDLKTEIENLLNTK
jgi:uncharacterized protein with HEPN domain